MSERALIQQMLDALDSVTEYVHNNLSSDYPTGVDTQSKEFYAADKAITAAREYLAESEGRTAPEQSEPVNQMLLEKKRHEFGYAKGYYMNTCIRCKKQMEFVDKRCYVCMECADAAIAAAEQAPHPPEMTDELASCVSTPETGLRLIGPHGGLKGDMPNPSAVEIASPLFNAIWDACKTWDVNAPEYYVGYCGFNGSHAKLILDAVLAAQGAKR